MSELLSLSNPVFSHFAFYGVVVCFKLLGMGLLTSFKRIANNIYPNPEDVSAFYKGNNPDKKKPRMGDETVERVRRNHLNDLENIPVFLVVGLLYVLIKPDPWMAMMHFRVFAVSRILHTLAYQAGVQPWRALFHTVALTCTISMGVQVLMRAQY